VSRIVVYGAADQGRCTVEVVEREGAHTVVGFLDDAVAPGTIVGDHAVLGRAADLTRLRTEHGIDAAVVAIGDNFRRSQVVAALRAADPTLAFATAVDPSAVVARDVQVGEGAVLMAGVVVNGGSTIGAHGLLCARSSLDHDATLGDFGSLAPAAATGGRVSIGHHSAICIGAVVLHGRSVGAHAVVGAGSTVVDDIDAGVVAYGTPCRPVRRRDPGDRYL
jgi:sugar O-acyltransferase (sialic acid O-acetyltransferase NeuD family)